MILTMISLHIPFLCTYMINVLYGKTKHCSVLIRIFPTPGCLFNGIKISVTWSYTTYQRIDYQQDISFCDNASLILMVCFQLSFSIAFKFAISLYLKVKLNYEIRIKYIDLSNTSVGILVFEIVHKEKYIHFTIVELFLCQSRSELLLCRADEGSWSQY